MALIRLGNKPPLIVAPNDSALGAARALTERQVGLRPSLMARS